MPQPSEIRLEEGPQIRNAVFQHGQPVDPHAEGKALHLVRIQATCTNDIRMHHAGSEDFQPAVADPNFHLALFPRTVDVHFHAWFGERKMRGAEAHFHRIDFKERLAEFLKAPFQVPQMGLVIQHQAFNLMEHRGVGLV